MTGWSVPDGYSLVTRFTFAVLPRNIQYVRFGLARHHFQAFQLVLVGVRRSTVNPCSVGHDRLLFRPDRLDCVKFYMSPRGAAARRSQVFEEDGKNLDAPARLVARVR